MNKPSLEKQDKFTMKQQIFSPRFLVLTVMVLIAALTRLLPHPPNVTPIAAMALFGGAYFLNKKLAFIIPLIALFLSDVLLELITGWGFHEMMWAVYLSFAIIAGIGLALKGRVKPLTVISASLAGSLLFFLLTNFAVWLSSPLYSQTFAGLIMCYEAAIPFFRNTTMGDLFFVAVLFGAFELAKYRLPVLAKA